MAVSHVKKVAILDDLTSNVATQKAVLVLSTNKAEASLNSELNTKIRKEARKNGVILKVIKNTLIKKAFENIPDLVGQTYLAYLENKEESDEITVPKSVVSLVSKDFKENFVILGSVVNGEFLNSAQTVQLSKTPSLQDSMAMVAGSLNQIATRLAIAVKEIPSGVARGVSEVQKIKA